MVRRGLGAGALGGDSDGVLGRAALVVGLEINGWVDEICRGGGFLLRRQGDGRLRCGGGGSPDFSPEVEKMGGPGEFFIKALARRLCGATGNVSPLSIRPAEACTELCV